MTARPGGTRQRMVASTAVLIREHGASATSIDAILAHSGAPRGSVYHHFPGGRAQLVEEAVTHAGDHVAGLIEASAAAGDPVAAVDAFFAVWRDRLAASDFRAGCPVVAVAVESPDASPQAARAAGAAFARWRSLLVDLLTGHGVPKPRARTLASVVLAAVEGAVIMSRAEHDMAPLDAVAAEVHDLLAAAQPEGRS